MTLISSAIDTSTRRPTGAAVTTPATQSTQTHRNDVTAADLYIARRSTQASQATAKSALMAAARILGHDRFDEVDWVIGYQEAALIRSGKGGRFRTIPIPQWAIALLADWLLISASPGPLLRQVDRWQNVGRRMSGHAIGGVVDRLCDGAQLARCGCHGLRRYAITDVLRHSDVGIARVFAGHADCSTTIRSYDSSDLKDLELVVRQRTLST